MCTDYKPDVPTIVEGAELALNVGSAVAQNQAAKKQAAATKESALASMQDAWAGINLRESQEQSATGQSVMAIDRAARTQRAAASLAAGEAGVSGISVDALLNDITSQELQAKLTERRNLEMTTDQLQREKVSGYTTAQSRINGAPSPNPYLTALQIGGATLNTALDIYDRKHPSGER